WSLVDGPGRIATLRAPAHVGSATDGLESDEDQDRATDPAPEQQVEQRPASSENRSRGSNDLCHHGDEPPESALRRREPSPPAVARPLPVSYEGQASPAEPPLAPRWHTAALVVLYLLVALVGTLVTARHAAVAPSPTASRIVGVYAPLVV